MADESTEKTSSNPDSSDVAAGSDVTRSARQRPTSLSVDDAECDDEADAFDDQPEANSWPVCTAARFLTSHGRRRHSELRSMFKRLVLQSTIISFFVITMLYVTCHCRDLKSKIERASVRREKCSWLRTISSPCTQQSPDPR